MFDRANDFVPTLDTISGPREAGIGAKVRSADSLAQADPLFVGHREDDDPPLLTLEDAGGAGEGVMKSGGFHLASALAGAAELHPDGLTMKIGIQGLFVQLRAKEVMSWLARPPVKRRLDALERGHQHWTKDHKSQRPFPGGPYLLLHTLSHVLIQSLAMRCGYPASSIRERIYAGTEAQRFGVLLYTGSPDAEGTLGGLVQQARHLEDHLVQALRMSALCSNDPICAHHVPGKSLESRWLHGAACHGCALVAETSCEMRNDYLDRALVVPVIGVPDAAFFQAVQ
jgi:hypothetical protein